MKGSRSALVALGLAVAGAGGAGAVVDWRAGVLKCTEDHPGNAAAIGDCVTKLTETNKLQEATEAAAVPLTPVPSFTLRVRDSSTAAIDYSIFDLGAKGATFSWERSKGEEANVVKAGVFGYFPPVPGTDGRLQAFVGASIVKEGVGTGKKDIRDVTVGMIGPILQTPKEGDMTNSVTLLPTWQYIRRDDKYTAGEGNLFRLHGDLVWLPLASGELLGVAVVPQAGYLWHRRTGGGPEDGRYDSAYLGFTATKTIGRLQMTLVGRRLYDTQAPQGIDKRRDSFAALSFDYYFYNPKDKTVALQPSIFITRTVGDDFLTGVGRENKTTAGLRVKFN